MQIAVGFVVDGRTLPIDAARPSRARSPIDAFICPGGRRPKDLGHGKTTAGCTVVYFRDFLDFLTEYVRYYSMVRSKFRVAYFIKVCISNTV